MPGGDNTAGHEGERGSNGSWRAVGRTSLGGEREGEDRESLPGHRAQDRVAAVLTVNT